MAEEASNALAWSMPGLSEGMGVMTWPFSVKNQENRGNKFGTYMGLDGWKKEPGEVRCHVAYHLISKAFPMGRSHTLYG